MRALLTWALLASVLGCGRRSESTITADPSAKTVKTARPETTEAGAVYAVVLQDYVGQYIGPGKERVGIVDATSGPPCGDATTLAMSIPTARKDTLDAWSRLTGEPPLAAITTSLNVERIPLDDAIAMLAGNVGAATKPWPPVGLVRFTPVAFDATKTDALVGIEHWSAATIRVALVVHAVRRGGTWVEQEVERCP
jgi:hypothetical protein